MRTWRMAGLWTVVLSMALAGSLWAEDKPKISEGLKGFKGALSGTVGEVNEKGTGFHLKVAKADPVEGSTAKEPGSAVGQTLLINPQWEKGADGKWHPKEAQVNYIKSLKAGQEVRVMVINDELSRLHLLEVPAAK